MIHQDFASSRVRLTATYSHPQIGFHGKRFICNGSAFSLAKKPISGLVIETFMSSSRYLVSRDEIVKQLFYTTGEGLHQIKLDKVRHRSLNRLICRLRCDFSKRFNTVMPPGTHWFYYLPQQDSWLLYRLPGEGVDGNHYK